MSDYFTYGAAELAQHARMQLTILDTARDVFQAMALDMVATIEDNNARNEKTVFIVPVGPVGHYPLFVEMVNKKRLSLKNVWFVNMDEYLDEQDNYLPLNHRLSFRSFMNEHVYEALDPDLVMPPSQRLFPDPADPAALDRQLEALGKIDVCYGGVGITGHVAFNEPEDVSVQEFSRRPTRVLTISAETRTINSVGDLNGALDAMPKRCVTIGMQQILSAKRVYLACFRDWHRAVVRQAVCGTVTAAFPVTLLQNHPDASITIPKSIAEPAYPSLLR